MNKITLHSMPESALLHSAHQILASLRRALRSARGHAAELAVIVALAVMMAVVKLCMVAAAIPSLADALSNGVRILALAGVRNFFL